MKQNSENQTPRQKGIIIHQDGDLKVTWTRASQMARVFWKGELKDEKLIPASAPVSEFYAYIERKTEAINH